MFIFHSQDSKIYIYCTVKPWTMKMIIWPHILSTARSRNIWHGRICRFRTQLLHWQRRTVIRITQRRVQIHMYVQETDSDGWKRNTSDHWKTLLTSGPILVVCYCGSWNKIELICFSSCSNLWNTLPHRIQGPCTRTCVSFTPVVRVTPMTATIPRWVLCKHTKYYFTENT